MKIIGERLRSLRESVRLSQAKLAKEFDVSQSALARYEIDDSTPSPEVFLKYADYFDVSLDYIFGRTDDPHGMIYNNCVKLGLNNPEMARFVEMCFDPGSAMNERLKATLGLHGAFVLLPVQNRQHGKRSVRRTLTEVRLSENTISFMPTHLGAMKAERCRARQKTTIPP